MGPQDVALRSIRTGGAAQLSKNLTAVEHLALVQYSGVHPGFPVPRDPLISRVASEARSPGCGRTATLVEHSHDRPNYLAGFSRLRIDTTLPLPSWADAMVVVTGSRNCGATFQR